MKTNWTEEDVLKVMAIMRQTDIVSLSASFKTDDSSSAIEVSNMIVDSRPTPQEIVEQHERNNALMEAVRQLRPRDQMIIQLRYGLIDGVTRTLDEVGEKYGLTRERIRQIERKALIQLKQILIKQYKMSSEDI